MLVQIAQIQAFFLAMVEMEMDLSRPEKSDILKSLQLFFPPQKFSFKKKISRNRRAMEISMKIFIALFFWKKKRFILFYL